MRAAAAFALALAACATARADETDYEVRVASDVTIDLGANGAISVALVPATGRTISADGPVRLAVTAPEGLGLPRRRYARKDAADPAADAPRFDVRVKAREPGDHAVALDVRFWLCGSRVCRPITTTRTVTVHVPAPMPASPPRDGGAGPSETGVDAATPVDASVDALPVDAGRRRPR